MLKTRKNPEKLVLEGVYIFRKANVHTMYTHVHRFFSTPKGVYICVHPVYIAKLGNVHTRNQRKIGLCSTFQQELCTLCTWG